MDSLNFMHQRTWKISIVVISAKQNLISLSDLAFNWTGLITYNLVLSRLINLHKSLLPINKSKSKSHCD
jgi:hypothetical protein